MEKEAKKKQKKQKNTNKNADFVEEAQVEVLTNLNMMFKDSDEEIQTSAPEVHS